MSKDKLFLIVPGFEDPKHPGKRFYCPHCNQVEGVLAQFPDLLNRIEVVRVPFPRPRAAVIAEIGEENQGLPVLILGDAGPLPADAKSYQDKAFISDTRRILELLSERHGLPLPH